MVVGQGGILIAFLSAFSTDTNLTYFSVLGILKAKILFYSHQSLNGVNVKLNNEWINILDEILHAPVNDVRKHVN